VEAYLKDNLGVPLILSRPFAKSYRSEKYHCQAMRDFAHATVLRTAR